MSGQVSARNALDFQRELGRYWRYVRRQGSLQLTAQGWVHRNNFKGLLTAMGISAQSTNEADHPRLRFTRLMLVELGALVKQDRVLVAQEEAEFFSLPLAERVKRTFDTWLLRSVWNELADIEGVIQSHVNKREAAAAMQRARRVVINTMREQSQSNLSGWHTLDELATMVHIAAPEFLFKHSKADRVQWFYGSPYYGANNPFGVSVHPTPRGAADVWERVERPFIAHLIAHSLHWQGLVELRWRSAEQVNIAQSLEAYRLTDSGAWLLDLAQTPSFAEDGGRIVVQPNFTILALEPISDVVLAELESFADFQGGERALHYQLTRQSAYRGQNKGWTAARMAQFLEQHQGAAIPANVRRTLEDWEASCRRVIVRRRVALIQFADITDASQVLPAIAPLNPVPLGTHFVQIPHGTAQEANQRLMQAGWAPAFQSDTDDGMQGAITINKTGEVQFTSATPSIQAQQFVALLTERTILNGRPSLVLTRQRVSEVLAQGMSLEMLIKKLSLLQGKSLSPVLQEQITQWARFHGSAAFSPITLVRFSKEGVLDHALEDGELRPLIFRRLSTVEALVEVEKVEQLQAKLAERGIEITRTLT